MPPHAKGIGPTTVELRSDEKLPAAQPSAAQAPHSAFGLVCRMRACCTLPPQQPQKLPAAGRYPVEVAAEQWRGV